jgi:N-acetylneuraminic acid mutarotase
MCANVVDGKIYLIGGLYQSVPNATLHLSAETEVYDPATDSWTAKASIPNSVFNYASAVVDNKIYVIAGNSGDTTNLTQVYNPETDKWSYGASIPTGVQYAAAGSTTGIYATKAIYVFGGFVGLVSPLDLTQIYYPENDSWNTGASLLTARYGIGVAVINDTLFAIGGKTVNAYGPVTNENSQYIPSGYQTIQTSPSPSPTPNPTSSIPEFPSLIFVLPLIVAVSVGLLVYFRKRKHQP